MDMGGLRRGGHRPRPDLFGCGPLALPLSRDPGRDRIYRGDHLFVQEHYSRVIENLPGKSGEVRLYNLY